VQFRDVDVRSLSRGALRRMRRHMQIIFQDPYSSLDPRMRAGQIVEEPLAIHRVGGRAERVARVAELFELVGLDPAFARRYPHEFSGGQRQRIGIARALALNPSLVVADEAVSSLDGPMQAQILQLLTDLRQRLGLSYLFISHDLRVVRRISDRVCVLYRGRIVEMAEPDALFANAAHPYTRALISAMPRLMPGDQRSRVAFDESTFAPCPLRDLGHGHWAAV
jgi:ABC-type oligopeptide transport system ATPase subunit